MITRAIAFDNNIDVVTERAFFGGHTDVITKVVAFGSKFNVTAKINQNVALDGNIDFTAKRIAILW